MRSNHFNHKIFKYFILLCSLFWVSSQQFQNSVNVSGGEQYSLWFRSLFFSLMTKILVLQVSLYVFPQWVLNSNLLVWNFGFSISVCCSNSWMTWNGQISFFFFLVFYLPSVVILGGRISLIQVLLQVLREYILWKNKHGSLHSFTPLQSHCP